MNKISPEHLARGAFVYVRQSTADQLRNNHESRRRQYALAERAQMLGWSEVVVIDDDLGKWRARASSGCWRPSALGRSARWYRSRHPDWRATVATGIRCWSSAPW